MGYTDVEFFANDLGKISCLYLGKLLANEGFPGDGDLLLMENCLSDGEGETF
jgi:hypothetical protein